MRKGGSQLVGVPGASGKASLGPLHLFGQCSVRCPLTPAILGPLGNDWGWGQRRVLALYSAHTINNRIMDFWRSPA